MFRIPLDHKRRLPEPRTGTRESPNEFHSSFIKRRHVLTSTTLSFSTKKTGNDGHFPGGTCCHPGTRTRRVGYLELGPVHGHVDAKVVGPPLDVLLLVGVVDRVVELFVDLR